MAEEIARETMTVAEAALAVTALSLLFVSFLLAAPCALSSSHEPSHDGVSQSRVPFHFSLSLSVSHCGTLFFHPSSFTVCLALSDRSAFPSGSISMRQRRLFHH